MSRLIQKYKAQGRYFVTVLICSVLLSSCSFYKKVAPTVLERPDAIQLTECGDLGQVADGSFHTVYLGGQPRLLEVVSTANSITQGLSDRTEVGSDGMLFVLPQTTQAQFWMKDMLFDLDMVWIKDCQILGVTQNVPHPSVGATDRQLPVYDSPGSVDMVLEVPAGSTAAWGLENGDLIQVTKPQAASP